MQFRPLVALLLSAAWAFQNPQQPTLKSGVELVLVDVQVTSKDGTPMQALTADQFEVTIDGKKRPVVNLDFVEFGKSEDPPTVAPGMVPAGTAPGALGREGRVIVIGVDQSSLQTGSEPAAREAVTRVIEMANPEDAIGLFGVPEPGVSISPTRDRAVVKAALSKISGQLSVPTPRLRISLSEAVDTAAGWIGAPLTKHGRPVPDHLIGRECAGLTGPAYDACVLEIQSTVQELAQTFELQALRSISGLHSLMAAVKDYPGRKTVVIVSGGFATSDRVGGRPDVRAEAIIAGQKAAEANAVLYSLRLDAGFLMAFSSANASRNIQTMFRDSRLMAAGLERFTASAGGTLIEVPVGADPAVKRLLRETSAYYLLGVEALPEHRDGKTHRIQVKVKKGEVRARSAVVIPKAQ
jgi:VWFA-related protein